MVRPKFGSGPSGSPDVAREFEGTAPGEGGAIADQNVKLLNGLGQVRQEKALGAGSIWDFVDIVYDNMGRMSQQTRPYRSGDTGSSRLSNRTRRATVQ